MEDPRSGLRFAAAGLEGSAAYRPRGVRPMEKRHRAAMSIALGYEIKTTKIHELPFYQWIEI